MKADQHYVYLLRCADDTFYCGYTTDVERRIQEHNGESKVAGARYTRGRRPVQLIHQEAFQTRSEALQREVIIKRMNRNQKILLTSPAVLVKK